MIGDRLNIDVVFGTNAGFKTLLVETGDHKMAHVEEVLKEIESGSENDKNCVPDFVISSLGKFL